MTQSARPVDCLIALGSNIGDRLTHLRFALKAIARTHGITVTSVSNLYKTAPVGGPENQSFYYNAALRAQSNISAKNLLLFLHSIERQRQRERDVRWGPRTLDLDLLTYGSVIEDQESLMLPHPRMHERRFVMVPVCDIAPSLLHPRLGQSMHQLLLNLPVQQEDLSLVCQTWWCDIMQEYTS